LLPPDILQLKCTKFDFGWGSAQTPLGSALDPPARCKGHISIGEGKDQEAVTALEGARGLNVVLVPQSFSQPPSSYYSPSAPPNRLIPQRCDWVTQWQQFNFIFILHSSWR